MIINRNKKPVGLIILDGWGVAPAWGGNAIVKAKTKTFNKIWQKYPKTTLLASGDAVGLPRNAPGNSEAGHLNIGAGKVVHQDISIIDRKIEDGTFFTDNALLTAIDHAKKNRSSIHLLGLLSNVGTHSHVRHLYALLALCKKNNFARVYIHLFSDGRDANPMTGIELISKVEEEIKKIGVGRIASVSGRYFAMDRDNRWGRISRAYNMLTRGEGNVYRSAITAFSSAYAAGQTDEFIEPRLIGSTSEQINIIQDNDSIIIFNFRSDRIKELTRAFLNLEISEYKDRKKLLNIYLVSLAIYDDDKTINHAFRPEMVGNPLAKVVSEQGFNQFHMAETEKYPHITYFINGGREKSFQGEERYLIPSPRGVRTYDLAPKMSAEEVTNKALQLLSSPKYDLFMLNYANADMVGHSGNFNATVHAIEFVDLCLSNILEKVITLGGTTIIVGDHGNAEQMVNPHSGEADTEHTTNPVPFIIVSADPAINKINLISDGILSCISPTILEIMNLQKPAEMQNDSLIVKELLNGK